MRLEKPDRQSESGDDDLLVSLREALRPEPLPGALADRIRADFDRRGAMIRRSDLPLLRLIGLAAAAGLIVAVMRPPNVAPKRFTAFAPPRLSSEEAAGIVAAYGVLSWESPFDGALDAVDARLDSIERTLQREAGSTRLLPWGPEDDWDVPQTGDGGSSRQRMSGAALCLAAREREHEG